MAGIKDAIRARKTQQDLEERARVFLQGHGWTESDVELFNKAKSIRGQDMKRLALPTFRALQLIRIGVLQRELMAIQSNVLGPLALGDIDMRASVFGLKPKDTEDNNEDNVGNSHAPQIGQNIKGKYTPKERYTGKDVDELLQKYADAVRNYETLCQDVVSREIMDYEFLGKNEDFQLMFREDASWWQRPIVSLPYEGIGSLGFREVDKKGRVEREARRTYASRLSMALFGGLALIIPMLIMALRRSLKTALITSSVATVFFGVIIAVVARDATGKDVLAPTAAYAAVLVVFVGVSMTPVSGASGPSG